MQFWSATSGTELGLLLMAAGLCAFIGLERQFRQKAAGFRTHVLVGTGSAAFTLVSAFGFESVLGQEVNLDPARIAAQIVSGIGFLGAGVIFTHKDAIRGLTTAATIWMAAAVGMASGAGMVSLAVGITVIHLFALLVLGPLVARIPTRDTNRVVRILYIDGEGVLRRLLSSATSLGFSALVLSARRVDEDNEVVQLDVRFKGNAPLRALLPALYDIDGVRGVEVRSDSDSDDKS